MYQHDMLIYIIIHSGWSLALIFMKERIKLNEAANEIMVYNIFVKLILYAYMPPIKLGLEVNGVGPKTHQLLLVVCRLIEFQ